MPKKFSLVAFRAAGGQEAKSLPDRLLVVPWGTTETRKGRIVCNETTVAELEKNQLANKYDRVALDFQHNTVKGQEPVKVAGYGIPEVVPGEGVYLSSIEYTEDGKALLAAGHYPDISPAVVRNEKNEVVFLHSVGACRQGEIDGLTLFSASDDMRIAAFEAIDEDLADADDLREVLVGLIRAIDPEASIDDDMNSGAIAAAARTAAEKLRKPEAEEPTDEVAALSAKVAAFEARFLARERSSLLARASAQGKVVPLSAEEIERMDLTILESMIEKLPATVPVEARTAGAVDDFSATGPQITPEMREVARQVGIDVKDLVA